MPSFFSKMHALASLLLLAPPTQCSSSVLLLYQLPQCSNSQQSNIDLLPQIHGKASKDTIPTVYSIKTHHTHKITKISLLKTEISFLRLTKNPNIYIYIYILTQLYNQRKIIKKKKKNDFSLSSHFSKYSSFILTKLLWFTLDRIEERRGLCAAIFKVT